MLCQLSYGGPLACTPVTTVAQLASLSQLRASLLSGYAQRMKLSILLGGAVGYVLGARAGRERYEAIVRLARRVAGSQTIQSAAGVFQAQVDEITHRVRETVAAKVGGGSPPSPSPNGAH